ncbi:MAG: AmmeMemoRadiSam system radical SAM enzyme [Thermoguttaceae bacterium]|nr:AmmeMemoRadiSam system radical SAM enzyme [Thermoguttaceae bacterium]
MSNKVVCPVCPRRCSLSEGQRGVCHVRACRNGEVVSTTYGINTGLAIDPIEKKPLAHFYPGSTALSLGTAGCNLGCLFCQNSQLSSSQEDELRSVAVSPQQIAQTAVAHDCKSVAYTYNDPVVWYEYAADSAKACRDLGVKNVAVTGGYILPEARKILFENMDAANVDLKGIRPEYYQAFCRADVNVVLDTLKYLKNETDVWLEVTNLVVPSITGNGSATDVGNDSDSDLQAWCDWVLETLGDAVPVHFSAFYPKYKIIDRQPTSFETLLRAWNIARKAGLKYVYLGNVRAAQYEATYCPNCGKPVIVRDGYRIDASALADNPQGIKNVCNYCGTEIDGRF